MLIHLLCCGTVSSSVSVSVSDDSPGVSSYNTSSDVGITGSELHGSSSLSIRWVVGLILGGIGSATLSVSAGSKNCYNCE